VAFYAVALPDDANRVRVLVNNRDAVRRGRFGERVDHPLATFRGIAKEALKIHDHVRAVSSQCRRWPWDRRRR
jgi:hypothetical protein